MKRPEEVNRESGESATVSISLSEDIKTLEELERSARAVLEQVQRTAMLWYEF